MADRPNFASVTDVPCKCGTLQWAANDARQPIAFDESTGEYHIQYRERDSDAYSMLVIYHCPFCGGAAPKSKRALLFHVIPPDEERRLTQLLIGITSLRSAIEELGKPDEDDPCGYRIDAPERDDRVPAIQWRRTLRYKKLSKVADVWFTECGDGRASWFLQGKAKQS